MDQAPEVLLSCPQVASILGLRPQTLRKWRLRGKGPRYVRLGSGPGARVAYRKTDLGEWLDQRTYLSTSDETVGAWSNCKDRTQEATPSNPEAQTPRRGGLAPAHSKPGGGR